MIRLLCGCEITLTRIIPSGAVLSTDPFESHEIEVSTEWDTRDSARIEFCTLHRSAAKMAELLKLYVADELAPTGKKEIQEILKEIDDSFIPF